MREEGSDGVREGGSEGGREGGSEGGREVGRKGKWKRWRGEKNEATKGGREAYYGTTCTLLPHGQEVKVSK